MESIPMGRFTRWSLIRADTKSTGWLTRWTVISREETRFIRSKDFLTGIGSEGRRLTRKRSTRFRFWTRERSSIRWLRYQWRNMRWQANHAPGVFLASTHYFRCKVANHRELRWCVSSWGCPWFWYNPSVYGWVHSSQGSAR